MNRATWKKCEREVALRLGGKRVPVTGRHEGDVEDVEHPVYAVEVKSRKQYPQLFTTAMKQAKLAGKRTSKIPVVVIHKLNTNHDEDFVVMRMKDFCVFGPMLEHMRKTP